MPRSFPSIASWEFHHPRQTFWYPREAYRKPSGPEEEPNGIRVRYQCRRPSRLGRLGRLFVKMWIRAEHMMGRAEGERRLTGLRIQFLRNRSRWFFQFFKESRGDSQEVNTSKGFDLSDLEKYPLDAGCRKSENQKRTFRKEAPMTIVL